MRKIELLSPAKDLECGLEAINHGADAVYIGAPRFSARTAAGNSISEIETLARYAHQYNAKVYVALNTILRDGELEEAERIVHELYHAGADAIIVQDMGILQLNLPPIALHASTQTDNRTIEKVRFLEKAGFSQIVLARELPLAQIRAIASQAKVPIEVFVHGALCVSYSGQCYISQAVGGRSANRGECAQFCRLPYDLIDAEGKIIMANKHLLSLKDLNLSVHLADLLEAGVSSLKIEGRLKDVGYVKNVTAYYRQQLDNILSGSSSYEKVSLGKVTYFFEPNPSKTFHRGSTDYFFTGRGEQIWSFDTPKSRGELIGKVTEIGKKHLTIQSSIAIRNGDGLCYLNKKGEFCGFNVNTVENGQVFPAQMPVIEKGTTVYRNSDREFSQTLQKKSAERKLALDIRLSDNENGYLLRLKDEQGNEVEVAFAALKEKSQKAESAQQNTINQLSKLGNTIFYQRLVEVQLSDAFFIPNSMLSDWRRTAIEKLMAVRELNDKPTTQKKVEPTSHPYPEKKLSYLGNVYNEKAREFYRQHGVSAIAPAFEAQAPQGGSAVPLMFCKHCIKYSLGYCTKYNKDANKKQPPLKEPLTLLCKNEHFQLVFNCNDCEMVVKKTTKC